MASSTTKKFVLEGYHIKKIIGKNGTCVNFGYGGLSDHDRLKLKDRHVIGLLSNRPTNHVDTQKVTRIYLDDCNGITDDSLIFIVDHFPQLEVLYAYNCNISALPNGFGDKLKHLQELDLRDNNITTPLPQSIANLAGTCTQFRIGENPLSEPLEKEAATLGLKQECLEEAAKFILTDDHIKKIIQHDGTYVDFWTGLSYDDASKLRDSHVIDLLSNPKHVDKQKVTHIDLTDCEGITDDLLVFIVDHCPQLKVLFAGTNCNISVLPHDFGDKLKHLEELYLSHNKITALPVSITKLKNLKELDLRNNKITKLPASISNLAGTCASFDIDGNPLSSKPLEKEFSGGFQQGMKLYFESKKTLEELERAANTHNDKNSDFFRLHEEESSLITHTDDVCEATVTSDNEPFVRTPPEDNPISNSTDSNDNADEARVVDSANNYNNSPATSFLGKRSRPQEQQNTTSADIPASIVIAERIMPDKQQVVIKHEPLNPSSSQKTNDAFDQQDYDMLRTHYLQPKVRKNEEIPSGMHLRTRHAPAAIDGKTEGYKQPSSNGKSKN